MLAGSLPAAVLLNNERIKQKNGEKRHEKENLSHCISCSYPCKPCTSDNGTPKDKTDDRIISIKKAK